MVIVITPADVEAYRKVYKTYRKALKVARKVHEASEKTYEEVCIENEIVEGDSSEDYRDADRAIEEAKEDFESAKDSFQGISYALYLAEERYVDAFHELSERNHFRFYWSESECHDIPMKIGRYIQLYITIWPTTLYLLTRIR